MINNEKVIIPSTAANDTGQKTTTIMSDTTSHNHATASLFQVYLRLKPAVTPTTGAHAEAALQGRYLCVEEANSADAGQEAPTHITVIPPADSRRRAVEKFAFTRVFQEEASQLDVFQGTNIVSLIEGVLAPEGRRARDGLVATLGVTGSGKVRRSFIALGSSHLMSIEMTDWERD